jgi:hypothetical protein
MSTFKRNGNKWSVNEILRLQREFELLELSIDDIATRHQRSPDAIMYKLDNEGFADFNVLYSNYYNLNDVMPILDDNNHEEVSHVYEDNDVITNNNITTLTEKVWNLETSVNEIKGLVKQMFNLMPNNPNNPNLAIY